MAKFTLKLLSFLFSLLLYGGLIFFLVAIFLKQERYKRIEVKGEPIEVVLEEKAKKVVTPTKPKREVQKTKPKPKPQGSKSPKQRSGEVKSLFSSLNAKKFTTKKTTPSRPKSKPSRKRGEAAKKLLENLELKSYELSSGKKSIKAVSGERDDYMQKVYAILYENWVPSKLSAGNEARVRFHIDIDGHIEYEVLSWSQSETFNEELKNYLRYLQTLQFPKPEHDRDFIVRFEAKE